MPHTSLSRQSLRTLAYLSILSIPLLASSQTASTTTSEQPDQTVVKLETLTVTGVRQALQTAIEEKRKANVVMDSISTEDIGKFPDRNLAESLQRITGVQITREGGEGKFVSVRGLPPEFNLITMNGHYVANASIDTLTQQSDRRFDFSILAPDFVQSLEVYKSPRADLDEGGVSSTINVKTLRPLEVRRRIASLSAEAQFESNSNKTAPKVSAVYSGISASGRMGFALSAVYDQRKYTELSTTTGQLNSITLSPAQIGSGVPLTAGTSYLMADSIGRTIGDQTRTRKSLTGTLQFEPRKHLRFTLDGLYADFEGENNSANFTSRPFFGIAYAGAPVTQATVDGNRVITSLQTTDTAAELQGFYQIEKRDVTSGSGDVTFDNGITFARLKLAYSDAEANMNGIGLDNFIWGPLSQSAVAGGYVLNANDPIASIVLPGGMPSPNQFANNYIGDNILTRGDRSFETQADFARVLDFGILRRVKLGVKIGDRSRTNNSIFLQDLRVRFLGSPTVQNLSRFVSGAADVSMDSYSGSNLNFTNFPRFIPQNYLDAAAGGSLGAWQSQALGGTGALSVRRNASLLYTVKEGIEAGYAMVEFGNKDSTISGNIGARVVNTDQTVEGLSVDLAKIQPSSSPLIPPVIPSSGPLTVKRSYTDVLPSFNMAWTPSDRKVVIRWAVAKVMSRPNLDSLVPRYSVSTSQTPFSISGGNPELKPYHAWQYDVSVEYYPKPGTIVSLAAFQKDIDSFTYTGTRSFTAGNNAFVQSLPINGSPATLRGLEANVTTFLDFLPSPFDGLGVQVNATIADGTIEADPANGLPERAFEGLSKKTYNMVLIYEKSGFSSRLAYNYRSAYVSVADLRAQHIASVQTSAFKTLDAQVSYDLTRKFSIFAQAINLLNESNVDSLQLLTNGARYPLNYTQAGRRLIVGARAKF